jgi:hypothetical protein
LFSRVLNAALVSSKSPLACSRDSLCGWPVFGSMFPGESSSSSSSSSSGSSKTDGLSATAPRSAPLRCPADQVDWGSC